MLFFGTHISAPKYGTCT